jgi:hypothetical protein
VSRPSSRFGESYYQRFYYNARTAVNTRTEMHKLARFIAAYVKYAGLPVKRILDAGCGCGWLRSPLQRSLPGAAYFGLECSEYLCRRYGWTRGSIDAFRAARPFELIVCNGVLQYLDDRGAGRAIANLGRLSAGLLYFNALTAEDWRSNCDRRRTDGNVHLRPASWYRLRLRRSYVEIGGGLWLRRGAGVTLWQLERAGQGSK